MATGLFTLKQVNQAIRQSGWPNQKTPAVNYLVVAGGGGGGGTNAGNAGGGGGGGLLTGIVNVATGTSYTVTIGGGGNVGAGSATGSAGGSTVFGNISATGGGGGGAYSGTTPGSGGSGGGSAQNGRYGGAGITGQGNSGGGFGFSIDPYSGGGGGGAGTIGFQQAGTSANSWPQGGNGGAGIACAISGTVTAYAGGGGGSTHSNGSAIAVGGVGGGGNGHYLSTAGTAGTANTGGGGGGAGESQAGGAGGSGIVILSYPDVYAAPTSTTGSPTVSTSGSGSLSFNGSSQFVGYANNAALQLTGDFTIEGWFYLSSSTGINQVVISKWNGANGYLIYYNAAQNKFYFQNNTVSVASSTTQSYAQYYHVAVTKSGNNYVLYVNGTSVGTATSATTPTDSSGQLEVGRNTDGSSNWVNGYISNVRIVKGTAVYTSNFTPSTTPLTAVSGTSLLLNTVSGAPYADGSTNSFATTTATSSVGPWNASSPFTVTGYKNRVYTWTSSGSITF